MRLFAGCDMTLMASEPCPTVAMLRPRSGVAQWLARESYQFDPPVRPTEYVDTYGNLCQRFEIAPGPMRIRWSAIVETDDVIAVEPNARATPVGRLPDDALQFMLQSRYCPSDKMVDQAMQIAGALLPGYAQVEAVRAWVHQNISVSVRREHGHDRRHRHAERRGRRVPGLLAHRHFTVPGTAHSRAHGGRLPVPTRPDGPARMVRGLHRRALVHLRRDTGPAARRPHRGGLRPRCRGRGVHLQLRRPDHDVPEAWVQLDNGLPLF